jgi:sulfite reductase beta subunit-like hemoprotein
MVDRELEGDWVAERDFALDRLLPNLDEEGAAPPPAQAAATPNGDRSEFDAFCADNVQGQRQQGFSTVHVKIVRGDLTPAQFRGLGAIMREYCGGNARTTVDQNLVLRWVRDESVYDVYTRLRELGLADPGADTITDVVSCPGTDSCKMGITATMGLNRALEERLEAMQITDPLTRKIHLKMSGCPNGCGQHHIGTIGFYGASIKVGTHTMPAYIPHIGGIADEGDVVFGTRLKVRLPAKRIPDAVERWLRMYEAERDEGEEFIDYASRVGTGRFEDEIRELSLPAEFNLENMLQFIDWSRRDPYKVQRGEGECAI